MPPSRHSGLRAVIPASEPEPRTRLLDTNEIADQVQMLALLDQDKPAMTTDKKIGNDEFNIQQLAQCSISQI